jgi:hypothetical protein
MRREDKSVDSNKQQRQAAAIEKGQQQKGVGRPETDARAWAAANKLHSGDKKTASRRKTPLRPPRRLGSQNQPGAFLLSHRFSQARRVPPLFRRGPHLRVCKVGAEDRVVLPRVQSTEVRSRPKATVPHA